MASRADGEAETPSSAAANVAGNSDAAEQLVKLQTKFDSWQKKAKAAVGKQRDMYDKLAAELEQTKAAASKSKIEHDEEVSTLQKRIAELEEQLSKALQDIVEAKESSSSATPGEAQATAAAAVNADDGDDDDLDISEDGWGDNAGAAAEDDDLGSDEQLKMGADDEDTQKETKKEGDEERIETNVINDDAIQVQYNQILIENESLKKEIEALKANLETTTAELNRTSTVTRTDDVISIADHLEKMTALENDLKTSEASATEAAAAREKVKIDALEQELHECQVSLDETRALLAENSETKSQVESRAAEDIESLKQQLEEVENDLMEAHEKNKNQQQSAAVAAEELAALQDKLNVAQEELAAERQSAASAVGEKEESTEAVALEEENNRDKEEEIAVLKNEIDALREQLESTHAELTQAVSTAKTESESAEAQIHGLKQEVAEAAAASASSTVVDEKLAASEEQIARLNEELDQTRAQLEEARAAVSATATAAQDDEETAKAAAEAAVLELEASREEVSALKAQLEDIKLELHTATSSLKKKEEEAVDNTTAAESEQQLALDELRQAHTDLLQEKAGVDAVNRDLLEGNREINEEKRVAVEALTRDKVELELSLQRTQLMAEYLESRDSVLRRSACLGPAPVLWPALRQVRGMACGLHRELNTQTQQFSQEDDLKEQLRRTQLEYGKYKTRSESALQIVNDELDELQEALKQKAEETVQLKSDVASVYEEVDYRDRTIATLEHQLEEAAQGLLTLQTDLQEAKDAHVAQQGSQDNLVDMGGNGAGAVGGVDQFNTISHEEEIENLQAQHNAETNALIESHTNEMQSVQSELTMLKMRCAMLQSKEGSSSSPSSASAGGGGGGGIASVASSWFGAPQPDQASKTDDAYVTTLLNQLEEAQQKRQDVEAQLKDVRSENQRVNARITILEGKSEGSHTKSGAASASKNMNAEELHRMLLAKSEQLWQANQEVLQLRAINAQQKQSVAAAHGGGSGGGGNLDASQLAYLRAILVKVFCEENETVKGTLLPVLATMVNWSTEELRDIYHANPEWRTV